MKRVPTTSKAKQKATETMKLYYIPGACSLSPNIVLREAGLDFELERYDPASGETASGARFRDVNPKAKVPALQLDDGELLTEGAAIVQFIADRHPEAELAPRPGTLERARVNEHLTYISSELHKSFGPLFSAETGDAAKEAARAQVANRLDHIEALLSDGRRFLAGDAFSIADPYLFTVARWTGPTGIGLDNWPHIAAYVERVGERPAVQAALAAEAG